MHDKILLIEDDASIIRFLSLSLDKNGYKVIAVSYTHLTLPTILRV